MNWLKLDNDRIAVWGFDLDGNVLPTNQITKWYFKEVATGKIVDTTELNSWKYFNNPDYTFLVDWDIDSTLLNFRESADVYSHPEVARLCDWPDSFITDIKEALDFWKVSPSLESFKDIFLVKARICSIITARWNSPDVIERWIKYINKTILTVEEKEEQVENIIKNFNLSEDDPRKVVDYYLTWIVYYIWINNPHVAKLWDLPVNGYNNWEIKWQVMNNYVNHVYYILERLYKKPILDILSKESRWLSIWFSDDGRTNIVEVFKANINKLKDNDLAWKYHKYIHYFTWDKNQYGDLIRDLPEIAWEGINLDFVEHDDKLEITFQKK